MNKLGTYSIRERTKVHHSILKLFYGQTLSSFWLPKKAKTNKFRETVNSWNLYLKIIQQYYLLLNLKDDYFLKLWFATKARLNLFENRRFNLLNGAKKLKFSWKLNFHKQNQEKCAYLLMDSLHFTSKPKGVWVTRAVSASIWVFVYIVFSLT